MAVLPPGRPAIRCIEGWVNPRTDLTDGENLAPPPSGCDPLNVQSVASCYTDYTILANHD